MKCVKKWYLLLLLSRRLCDFIIGYEVMVRLCGDEVLMSRNHKDLKVWQESMSFVTKIYVISGEFPKSELYGLVNQIRRAAVSIPSNIAEGAARDSAKENIHFLYYSLGSLAEVETQLLISSDLNYIKESTIKELLETIKYIRVMLSGLIKSLAK